MEWFCTGSKLPHVARPRHDSSAHTRGRAAKGPILITRMRDRPTSLEKFRAASFFFSEPISSHRHKNVAANCKSCFGTAFCAQFFFGSAMSFTSDGSRSSQNTNTQKTSVKSANDKNWQFAILHFRKKSFHHLLLPKCTQLVTDVL